jgi:hypothetical protein
MALKGLPRLMKFVSNEHAPFSTVGNGPCRPNFGHGKCFTWSLASIKAWFLQLGYTESDVGQLRRHCEVRVSKPMSDRSKSWHYRTLGQSTDI